MKVRPFFRWYDLWVGVYVQADTKTIYVCLLPTLGFQIDLEGDDG